jgi:hypothetical protein
VVHTVFWSFRPIKYSEIEKINSLSGEVAEIAVGHNQAQDKKFGFVDEDANLNCYRSNEARSGALDVRLGRVHLT